VRRDNKWQKEITTVLRERLPLQAQLLTLALGLTGSSADADHFLGKDDRLNITTFLANFDLLSTGKHRLSPDFDLYRHLMTQTTVFQ
jgi:hypothetical protein